MKKSLFGFLYLFTFILCIGCDSGLTIADASEINGYWQIEMVTLEDGNVKDFRFSPLVDFIEVKGDAGIRKKVTPRLDGSFEVTNSSEAFILKIENDSLRMLYSTPFNQWQETIVGIEPGVLKILNRDGKLYTYKPYEKIDLTN